MQKILIITYYWPPGAGAGVQRWLKFSKYLPSFGWEPVILTVDPKFASYPATDITLEKGIPESTRIYKTPATDYFSFFSKNRKNIPSAGFASGEITGLKAKLFRFIRGNFFIPDPRRGEVRPRASVGLGLRQDHRAVTRCARVVPIARSVADGEVVA